MMLNSWTSKVNGVVFVGVSVLGFVKGDRKNTEATGVSHEG